MIIDNKKELLYKWLEENTDAGSSMDIVTGCNFLVVLQYVR